MLNVFKLTQAINESASGVAGIGNIPAYNFIGDLDEAVSEMNMIMLSEQVSIAGFQASSEEILAEAAMTNPGNLEVMCESVVDSLKKHISAFFDKIVSMVKGIIQKLKEYFYRFTGKLEKWASIVKPRVEKTKKLSGFDDQQYEAHKWNTDFVTTGLSAALNSAVDGFATIAASGDYAAMIGDNSAWARAMTAKADMGRQAKSDKTDDQASGFTDQMDAAIDASKERKTAAEEKALKDIASDLGCPDPSDAEDLWNEVEKKANGGEKITLKIADLGGPDKMFDVVTKSKKTITTMQDAYTKHLTALTKMRTKVEAMLGKSFDKKGAADNYNSAAYSKYQALLSAMTAEVTGVVSVYESLLNNAQGKNKKYIDNMTSEYISILSKASNYKAKKEA